MSKTPKMVALVAITGIDVAGKRYEPGDKLTLAEFTANWLIEGGHARHASSKEATGEDEVTL